LERVGSPHRITEYIEDFHECVLKLKYSEVSLPSTLKMVATAFSEIPLPTTKLHHIKSQKTNLIFTAMATETEDEYG
jgi:hypothetical protein